MRRFARVTAAAVVLATTAMSGMLIGTTPQPVRALVALAVNDSLTMKHDRTAVVPAPGVMANDVVLLGGTVQLVSGVSHGTVSLQSNGGYTYTPASGYVGGDSFRYRLSGLVPTTATVTITITNAAPVAKPDAYSFAGSTLVVAAPGVLANDTDADGDTLVTDQVGGITGSLDLNANGGFQYTPGGGFSGSATFSYRVWDGVAWSGTTTVTLTGPSPTATPVPTSVPTPVPTPSPTPTPAPIPSIPLPIPSLPVPSLPVPSLPIPSLPIPSSPVASPNPSPVPSIPLPIGDTPLPTPSPSGGSTGGPPGSESSQPPTGTAGPGTAGAGGGSTTPGSGAQPPQGAGGAASRPGVNVTTPPLDAGVGTFGVFAGLEIWAVPAAVMGGPGLLVLLWIALQAAGATAWVPAARRLRDDDRRHRRRRTA